MRVALFITCLADALYPDVGKATVRLLERLGHQVVFPKAQTCCGQAHTNTGYFPQAAQLVRHQTDTFEEALAGGADAIVAPSGSCVGSVRHQHAMVARKVGDEQLAARAEVISAHTFELSEFLVDKLGVTDVGARFPHRVTYHPTCHSMRMVHVGDKPLQLLRAVRDIDLVELPSAEQCCGFGGTFALKNSATSSAMLADKTAHVAETEAQVLTAGDASCLMHIAGGLHKQGKNVRTLHLAEILACADRERHDANREAVA